MLSFRDRLWEQDLLHSVYFIQLSIFDLCVSSVSSLEMVEFKAID